MKKRILTAAAALTLAVFLTGCGSMEFVFSPQELYSLPELPAKYTELNRQINAILEGGAEYAAPTSGANIQPVQLADLDGVFPQVRRRQAAENLHFLYEGRR